MMTNRDSSFAGQIFRDQSRNSYMMYKGKKKIKVIITPIPWSLVFLFATLNGFAVNLTKNMLISKFGKFTTTIDSYNIEEEYKE